MLFYFDREDVCMLWKVLKEKFGATKFNTSTEDDPQATADFVMWKSLKLMFDPYLEDSEWREIKSCKVRRWMIFQSSEFIFWNLGHILCICW